MIPSVNAQNWSEEEKTAKKARIKLFSVHVAMPRHHLRGPLLGYRRQQVSQHGTLHHTNAFRLVASKPPPIYVIGFMKWFASSSSLNNSRVTRNNSGTSAMWGMLTQHPSVKPPGHAVGEPTTYYKEVNW